jgi:pilus assembly protein TadC
VSDTTTFLNIRMLSSGYLVTPVIAVAHVIARALAVANVMLEIKLLVPFFQLLLLLGLVMLLVLLLVTVVKVMVHGGPNTKRLAGPKSTDSTGHRHRAH